MASTHVAAEMHGRRTTMSPWLVWPILLALAWKRIVPIIIKTDLHDYGVLFQANAVDAEQHVLANEVLQLPDISGPRVEQHAREQVTWKLRVRYAELGATAKSQILGDDGQVRRTFPQGRHVDRHLR